MIEDQDNLIQVEEKVLISLYSLNATEKKNGANLSDLTFNLQEPIIKVPNVLNIKASILSFTCPNSQYVINDSNNTLVLCILTLPTIDPYYIKLTNGNYNASSFMKMVTTILNSGLYLGTPWSMSYNPNTYQLSLSSPTNDFTIIQRNANKAAGYTKISRLGLIMGFEDALVQVATITSNATITFPYPCNFGGLNSLNIKIPNLRTHSLDYKGNINTDGIFNYFLGNFDYKGNINQSNNNIAVSVPVNCNVGEVIYFNKTSNYEFIVLEEMIDKLDIQLTDDLGNFIQLNNQHYNLCIEFTITRLQHKKTRNFFEIINNPYPKYKYEPQY
jgi:hypothetical protein